jgi:hypothetical protein
MEAIDGNGFGFDIVIGSEPEMGVKLAFGGPDFIVRRIAIDFIEAPRDESKIDAIDGVC